jgi:hypothetical protein
MSIKSTPLVKSKSVQDLMDLCLRGAGLVGHFGTGGNIVLHLQFFGKKEGWTNSLPVIPSTMSDQCFLLVFEASSMQDAFAFGFGCFATGL